MSLRDDFEQLAQEVFDTWYRFSPVEASWLGIHAYDDQLADLSVDGIQERAVVFNELTARLAAIPRGQLPLAVAIDYEVTAAMLRSELWSIERVQEWQRNPVPYVQEPLFGLLVLTARPFAPVEQRAASALSRLRAVPDALEAGRVNVTNPPPIFVETAIQSSRGGASFVREAIPALAAQAGDLRDDLLEEAERAASVFDEYADFLTAEVAPIADGSFAVGRARFEERLRDWHMLDISADELAATGRRLFDDTLRQLRELAAEVAPGRDWTDLVREAGDDHPTADGLLDAYRDELARLRRFVQERDLVTIPGSEQLDVVETPRFQRPMVPYAAYMPPAPFEPSAKGEFWVTPVDTQAPPEQQRAQLREHSRGSYPITALHEGFPGHHLQLVWASQTPSFVRKHAQSELFAEGWAFYCEQMLGEQGYYRDWRLRLFQLKGQLWRSARVIIDPSLHTGQMSVEEAVDLLVDGAKLARAQAEGEVRRYCLSPTQPMTYAMGKEQILALRDELGGLSLREFHDRLLSSGTLPFALVRQEMLARGA